MPGFQHWNVVASNPLIISQKTTKDLWQCHTFRHFWGRKMRLNFWKLLPVGMFCRLIAVSRTVPWSVPNEVGKKGCVFLEERMGFLYFYQFFVNSTNNPIINWFDEKFASEIDFHHFYSVWHLVLQILREIFRSTFLWN